MPFNINTDKLLDGLHLDVRSIRDIYDYKTRNCLSEQKFAKITKKLMIKQLKHEFLKKRRMLEKGYMQEGDKAKRIQTLRNPTSKDLVCTSTFVAENACSKCSYALISTNNSSSPYSIFIGCGHTFHKHCLNIFYKEHYSSESDAPKSQMKCPECAESNTDISLA